MADETVDVEGVEVIYPGTYNGTTFTRADLEGIVEAFNATRDVLPPRLQLSHDMKQRLARAIFGDDADGVEGFPALGWPARLYMRGEKLLADVAQVPVKLAEQMKSGAYRARSAGVLINVKVNGKLWPMVLDHIALLGDQAPAVPGLADVKLERDGATWESMAVFAVTDSEATMARINALLDEAHGLAAELVRGRTGAPQVAAYMRGYRERLNRIVRQAHKAQETTNMAADPLTPGAAPEAGGMTISSADTLAAMLAAKLGLAPEDYAAIYAALSTMLDGPAPEPAEPLIEGGDVEMAKTDEVTLARADLEALQAQIKQAKDEAAAAKADVAKVEIARAQEAAERRADADIASRSLPASVRDTLVMLARDGHEAMYTSIIESAKPVPTTEQGTSTGGVNLSALEPTTVERSVAAQMGMTVEQFRAAKAREAGVELPAGQ